MAELPTDVVTGAFSYTGRHIAEQLLAARRQVRTLSRTPAPLGSLIEAFPFAFDDPDTLRESLRGAEVLYNTYSVRFPHGNVTFERAVENTLLLWRCAREAGVSRIVHVSVSNASEDSPLPYFRSKGLLERRLRQAGGSWAVVRPTWIFGPDDILVNNIAWGLRHLPVFPVPGDGRYRVQPVSVGDTARIAIELGTQRENRIVDAAGPETLSFDVLIRLVRSALGRRTPLLQLAPAAALVLGKAVSRARRDVLLTREEIAGLLQSLLVSDRPPLGRDSFRDWIRLHGSGLGRRYVSELARNYR